MIQIQEAPLVANTPTHIWCTPSRKDDHCSWRVFRHRAKYVPGKTKGSNVVANLQLGFGSDWRNLTASSMLRFQPHGLDATLLEGFCRIAHALLGGTYGQDACGLVYVWLRNSDDIVALGTCCKSTAVWLTPQCGRCRGWWRFVGGKSHVPWDSLLQRCMWATTCYECFNRERPYRSFDIVAPPLLDPIRSRRRIEHEATFPFPTDTPGVFMDICVWAPKPPGQGRRPDVIIRRVVERASWTYSCYLCRAENEYSVRDHFANGECRILNQISRVSDRATRHMREQIAESRRTGVRPWNLPARSSPPRTRRRLG